MAYVVNVIFSTLLFVLIRFTCNTRGADYDKTKVLSKWTVALTALSNDSMPKVVKCRFLTVDYAKYSCHVSLACPCEPDGYVPYCTKMSGSLVYYLQNTCLDKAVVGAPAPPRPPPHSVAGTLGRQQIPRSTWALASSKPSR